MNNRPLQVDMNQPIRLGTFKNGVFVPPDYILRNRHGKTAVGMTKTIYRSNHGISDVACKLSVKGSTDRLGAAWLFIRKDQTTGKYRLTDSGRKKLLRIKRQIERRKVA